MAWKPHPHPLITSWLELIEPVILRVDTAPHDVETAGLSADI